MVGKNIHVTYRKDSEQWQTKREGATKASGLFETKTKALEAGRDQAKNNHSELVIHDKQNIIRDKDSFGNDPKSIKDNVH